MDKQFKSVVLLRTEIPSLVEQHEFWDKPLELIEKSAADKLAMALEFYEDKHGGPYAAGDCHTADGGQRAYEALKEYRGTK